MVAAVVVTFTEAGFGQHYLLFFATAAPAVGLGLYIAQSVNMTEMPQLVALFHSFVGLAAVMVGKVDLNVIASACFTSHHIRLGSRTSTPLLAWSALPHFYVCWRSTPAFSSPVSPSPDQVCQILPFTAEESHNIRSFSGRCGKAPWIDGEPLIEGSRTPCVEYCHYCCHWRTWRSFLRLFWPLYTHALPVRPLFLFNSLLSVLNPCLQLCECWLEHVAWFSPGRRYWWS